MFKQGEKDMFKDFNWKTYVIKTIITWVVFVFIVGFVSGFKSYAMDEAWIFLGKNDEGTSFYGLRGSLLLNQSGNTILTLKVTTKELGERYAIWEFDCEKKADRVIQLGNSLNTMMHVSRVWTVPEKDSMAGMLLKKICSIGGS